MSDTFVGIDVGKPTEFKARYLHVKVYRTLSIEELTWFYREIGLNMIASGIDVVEFAKRDFDKHTTDWYFVINDAIGYTSFVDSLRITLPFVTVKPRHKPFPEQVKMLEDRHDD